MGIYYNIASAYEFASEDECNKLKSIIQEIVGYKCLLQCVKEWVPINVIDIYVADIETKILKDHLTIKCNEVTQEDIWGVAINEPDNMRFNSMRRKIEELYV